MEVDRSTSAWGRECIPAHQNIPLIKRSQDPVVSTATHLSLCRKLEIALLRPQLRLLPALGVALAAALALAEVLPLPLVLPLDVRPLVCDDLLQLLLAAVIPRHIQHAGGPRLAIAGAGHHHVTRHLALGQDRHLREHRALAQVGRRWQEGGPVVRALLLALLPDEESEAFLLLLPHRLHAHFPASAIL